ncbi:hypothetical protein Mal35_16850 [Gimesia maris]|nr:hypothetical protein Mal35_16850 [Gimesia maris]
MNWIIDWLIALSLLSIVISYFGYLLVGILIRLVTFMLMLWGAFLLNGAIALVTIRLGIVKSPSAACLLSTAFVLLLYCTLLRCMHRAVTFVRGHSLGTVTLDSVRVGLIVVIGATLIFTLASFGTDRLLPVSGIWLTILAVCAAGFDSCFPFALDGVATLISGTSPSVEHLSTRLVKGDYNHVS